MTDHDDRVRRFTGNLGRVVREEEMVQDVLSGRMDSNSILPLLAGIVDSAIRTVFRPVVGLREHVTFDSDARPMVTILTLLDGSRIQVTLEALPKEEA